PFLHAGAARRGNDDDRQVLVDGELDRARELLADDRPHTAAQKSELEHAQHRGHAADPRHPRDDRLVGFRLLHGGADPVAVLLGVPEAERVRGLEVGVALFERAWVRQERDTLARGDAEGIEALRADAPRALDLGTVDDLLARVALDPEPLGDVDAARLALGPVGLTSEPRSHRLPRTPARGGGLGEISQHGLTQRLLQRGNEITDVLHEIRELGRASCRACVTQRAGMILGVRVSIERDEYY